MSLTRAIKDFALDLGYHSVGIAGAEPFDEFARILEQRRESYATLSYLPPFADPHNAMPEARSIVVAVYDYFTEGFPAELVGKVGRLYQSRCYSAPPHRINGQRPALMRQFIESQGVRVAPWPGGRTGVPDRRAAARAGVAHFGRNNFVYAPRIGSWIMIHAFVVDAELEYDSPTEDLSCPTDCHKCSDACPTGALTDLQLDPRRCIAYNNFFTRGEETKVSSTIPMELRPKLGTWVHGCDECQAACPKNQPKLKAKLRTNPFLERIAAEFDLVSMLGMPGDYYARVVQPLMYNYIKDRNLLRRNAAIALGNVGDPAAVPALVAALSDPAEVVRGHAAWALGRIGGLRSASCARCGAGDGDRGDCAVRDRGGARQLAGHAGVGRLPPRSRYASLMNPASARPTASSEKPSSTRRLARLPSSPANAGSRSTRTNASATAAASCCGTMMPPDASPSPNISRTPLTSVVTTGSSQAIASRGATANPSWREVKA